MLNKPYSINIDLKQQIIIVSFKGEVYPKDVMQLLDDIFSHKDYNKAFPSIFDFSEAVAIGYQMDILPFVNKLGQFRSDVSLEKRIGVILKSSNAKFMVNLFLHFASIFNLRIQVFDESSPCVAWMKESIEDQEKLSQLLKSNKEELARRLESLE